MMDVARMYSKNARVMVVVGAMGGLLVGLLIGLLLGWVIWPVEWEDAGPNTLSPAWQDDYLRMAIADYSRTLDAAEAAERYKALGSTRARLLNAVAQDPQMLDPMIIAQFTSVVTGTMPEIPTPVVGADETPGVLPQTTPGGEIAPVVPLIPGDDVDEGSNTMLWLSLLCLLVLIAGGAMAYRKFLRPNFARGSGAPTAAQQAIDARKAASSQMTNYADDGNDPPIQQFMASYKLGDDLFDDSFSIDSPNGEFLGECGVGISDNIGVGEPKKVSAFEVWLFDKNDIQTVTKVLMSTHTFNDGSVRARLDAKGETVEATPGAEFTLETQTLIMVARVVDMGYGEGAMPGSSYFDRLLLELALWPKPA